MSGWQAAATVPAFGVAAVNVFGLKAPDEIEGFTLNDSTNFEKIKPGDGYGLDYSQSGWKLDVFIYDLKRAEAHGCIIITLNN